MKKKKKLARRPTNAQSFQRLVIVFVVVTIVALSAVVYYALAKTTIIVTPRVAQTPFDTRVTVGPANSEEPTTTPDLTTSAITPDAPDFPGTVLTADLTITAEFSDLASATEEPDRAGGVVRITNNWNQTQTLRAGTRLLSENGILFRTGDRVDAPPGGSVEVQVLADEPGAQGNIPPSRFEIVALWAGIKPVIYGESVAGFTGGTRRIARVTEDDLREARRLLHEAIEEQGSAMLTNELAKDPLMANFTLLATSNIIKTELAGANVGDEVGSFTSEAEVTVTGVAGDKQTFIRLTRERAMEMLGTDQQLVSPLETNPEISIRSADHETKTAVLDVHDDLETIVQIGHPMFDRTILVSRDEQEILEHFAQFESIASTEVRFAPFWAFRSSTLPDHIEIKLLEPVDSPPSE